ncbi:MAG: formyltransferase family protein, partial [Pirellulaceae bacterium]
MQIVITAVGPDNVRLVDPIIHYVTGEGANIAEVQMYDHDEQALFAMLLRIHLPGTQLASLRSAMAEIGKLKNLSIRVWSPEERAVRPRLAVCVTFRPETPLALLRGIRDNHIRAEVAVMIGNRPACRGIAEQFGVPWEMIGDEEGRADDELLVQLFDRYEVDYVVLARYMRVLSADACW